MRIYIYIAFFLLLFCNGRIDIIGKEWGTRTGKTVVKEGENPTKRIKHDETGRDRERQEWVGPTHSHTHAPYSWFVGRDAPQQYVAVTYKNGVSFHSLLDHTSFMASSSHISCTNVPCFQFSPHFTLDQYLPKMFYTLVILKAYHIYFIIRFIGL